MYVEVLQSSPESNIKKIARLIRFMGIHAIYAELKLSIPGHNQDIYQYLLTKVSNTQDAGFCLSLLDEALRSETSRIFNTDQGSQFTNTSFTQRLQDANISISMDGRGRTLDYEIIERLWRSLKYEALYLHNYSFATGTTCNIATFWRGSVSMSFQNVRPTPVYPQRSESHQRTRDLQEVKAMSRIHTNINRVLSISQSRIPSRSPVPNSLPKYYLITVTASVKPRATCEGTLARRKYASTNKNPLTVNVWAGDLLSQLHRIANENQLSGFERDEPLAHEKSSPRADRDYYLFFGILTILKSNFPVIP